MDAEPCVRSQHLRRDDDHQRIAQPQPQPGKDRLAFANIDISNPCESLFGLDLFRLLLQITGVYHKN